MLFACTLVLLLGSCKKEKLEETLIPPKEMKENTLANTTARVVKRKGNSLSAKNMRLSLVKLQANGTVDAKYAFKPANLWLYVKFSPNVIDSTLLKKVVNNDRIMVQNYPFANAELFYDDANITEEKRLALIDGDIYATLPADDMPDIQILSYEMLDSMYMSDNDEDPIMFDSMIEGGYITQEQVNQRWNICWRKPEGYIKFTDTQLGANQPVSETTAWVLFLGIPIWTQTDGNGYFRINWRFLVGTFVGTKANNQYNKIVPIDITGNWLTFLPRLFGEILIGSLHIKGWYGACNINSININFNSHGQQRTWAHILRTSYKHRQYCSTENIPHGQTSLLSYVVYTSGLGDGASAPMLGHINPISLIAGVLNDVFDMDLNASAPTFFNLLNGILPDMTFTVGTTPNVSFSTSFSQTVFHELSHVTHFSRVGAVYWIAYITDIIHNTAFSTCTGYGCGYAVSSGFTQVGESWAEFLSTNFAKRYYGASGIKPSRWSATERVPTNPYITFGEAEEYELWFFNDWIPSGFYSDCMDGVATNVESWDVISGFSIRELYLAHGISQNSMCNYILRMTVLYPTRVTFTNLETLFKKNTEKKVTPTYTTYRDCIS